MKKLQFLHTTGWENFLTGDYLGSVTEKIAQDRARWIDSTICEMIPAWKAKLLKMFPWSRLVWLLIPKITITNGQLLSEFGSRTTIRIGDKYTSRKWKI